MSIQNQKKLLEERDKFLKELGSLSLLLHGSWIERYSICSRPDCKCHKNERHGPRYYLVINESGKQRQKYIPLTKVKTALKGIAQYQRLQEIVSEITRLNLELMKGDSENDSK